MKRLLRRSTTFIGVSIIAVVLLVLGVFLVTQKASATNQSGRLVTIHDRGEEKVMLTQAATVGDALKEAHITLDNRDTVEPGVTQKLVASEYQINIYRARPVIIIDGATRQKVITPYQTADQIAKDAGITLYPEDTTTLSQSDNLVQDGAGLVLTIHRATSVSLTLYGTTTTIRTQGATVGAMFKEKGITLGPDDRASLPLSTPVTAGLALTVWREGKQTITVQEAVPFDTQQIQDADHEVGYKLVQTPGVVGQQNATYEVEIKDGQEVSRKQIAVIVTTQPIKQVEIVGVKPKTLPYTGGGDETTWLAASNIPQDDWGYADYIVGNESHWNPNSINASSGACGLAQALPCSKVPGNPFNPIDSLNWMNGYVNGRYGGWSGAYNWWTVHHWY